MTKERKLTVKHDDAVETTEILAESIIAIADGVKKLRAGRLNDKALALLISHASPVGSNGFKVSQRDVMAVLGGIENLKAAFIRKPKS